MASIFPRWAKAVERFGWRGTFDRCFAMGTVKFGKFVGEDHLGNKYYEDIFEKHGQHRWVEYKDLWDYDAAMVPPSWHGWLCHMSDEPGHDQDAYLIAKVKAAAQIDRTDSGPYDSHIGRTEYEDGLMFNPTQMKNRGYKIGNLHKKWDEPDGYYKQPGSETSDAGGEFSRVNGYEPWTPADPAGEGAEKMAGLRPLSEK